MTDLVASAASCYYNVYVFQVPHAESGECSPGKNRDPEEPKSWNQTAGAVVRLQAPLACALGKHPNCAYASFSYL